jgi:hypothetical protein
MWWRPNGFVAADEVLHSCLLTYLSGTTMVEPALVVRRATPVSAFNAPIDHALWFHRPVDLADWVLSDQMSSSGVAGRGADDVNDVQPHRPTRVHRDPGALLRPSGYLGLSSRQGPHPMPSVGGLSRNRAGRYRW